MTVISLIVSRPVRSLIFMTVALLFVSVLVIPCWYHTTKLMEHDVHLNSINFQLGLSSQVKNTAKLLHPLNSSATNLARILISSLNGTQISSSNLETKVAPIMFLSLSTIPYLSQISYIGSDGLFFSYYTHNNQTFLISSNSSNPNYWYTQPVNQNTGNPYGDAIAISINSSFFQEALKSKNGYASVEIGLKNSQDLVFLNTVSLNGSGALSLGFPVKFLIDFFGGIDFNGGGFFLATEDGKVLVEGNILNANMEFSGNSVFFQTGKENEEVGNVSCGLNNGGLRSSVLSIRGTKYEVYCSRVDIVGVQSVYALAFAHKGTLSNLQKNRKVALMLLILMTVIMEISILSFVILIFRATEKKTLLCASLFKQREATLQAERKSTNKSTAFANANHDVRSPLAAIAGLIHICYDEASPGSDLETNLKQMEACAEDLLGLLNSILDSSKIEAGKMQLEEEEFNLAQLLEYVVDLYHPAAMKKGVDVVLDPHDNSVIKFSQVKGDRGRLKQILCNLLDNAVKFTSEGHILVRAWVQKKSDLENSVIISNRNGLIGCLSCLFGKKSEGLRDIEAVNNNVNENVDCMEYVFEVDDTGKGIPKEKQESVFENYVQVKETGLGEGGTGLGLGIVQSLVRLMGGEIEIVDKQMGERGTCFRFNVSLAISIDHHHPKPDHESAADIQNLCLTVRTPSPAAGSGLSLRSLSPRLPISPKPPEGSHVVLLIQSEARRRNSQKFLESHGIKVSVAEQWESLPKILKKIKHKLNISGKSSDLSISSSFSSVDLGSDQILPIYRKINIRGSAPGFILLVIDAFAGPFSELCRIVAEFKRCTPGVCCKVVWLYKPTARSINFNLDPDDDIIRKPFHGSRLDRVLRFLPEFGGNLQKEHGSSSSENQTRKMLSPILNQTDVNFKSRKQIGVSGIQEHDSGKPLSAKKILVAEDDGLLRKVAMEILKKLGASVELCENGEKAFEMVRNGLSDKRKHTSSTSLPYDYVLMDCEMPIMNGYEATRRIRKVEKCYGVHIPIIALTAHTSGEEAKKTILAGMDVHLGKPLKREQLLEAIQSIDNTQ